MYNDYNLQANGWLKCHNKPSSVANLIGSQSVVDIMVRVSVNTLIPSIYLIIEGVLKNINSMKPEV